MIIKLKITKIQKLKRACTVIYPKFEPSGKKSQSWKFAKQGGANIKMRMEWFWIQLIINLKLNIYYYKYSHTTDLLISQTNLLNRFESQWSHMNDILKLSTQINKLLSR